MNNIAVLPCCLKFLRIYPAEGFKRRMFIATLIRKRYNLSMYLIAGLGNPTKKYANTRHNMGFDCIDRLSSRFGIKMKRSRFTALVGKGEIAGSSIVLIKPQTFMNLSGDAISRIAKYYKADTEKELIVIYDDTDLEIGNIRVRAKGSAGGHNGMKSIIANLNSDGFMRIRVGIGKREEDADMVDFVLGEFSKEERKEIERALDDAADAAVDIIENGIEHAMNKFNSLKH